MHASIDKGGWVKDPNAPRDAEWNFTLHGVNIPDSLLRTLTSVGADWSGPYWTRVKNNTLELVTDKPKT